MSKDLLRRKKKKNLKAGGLNPPADLYVLSDNSAEEPISDKTMVAADGAYGIEKAGDSAAEEEILSVTPENDEADDGLELVFADLFESHKPEPTDEVPLFFRRGKKAVVVLMCFLFGIAFAYNTVYFDILRTEVDSFIKDTPDNISPIPAEQVLPEAIEGLAESSRDDVITLYLTCDGQTSDYSVPDTEVTVEKLLERAGVTLSDEDTVEPELSKILSDRDSVTVTRIKHIEYTETAVIPASTDIKLTPLLYDGHQRELYAYYKEDGEKQLTYRDEYINGERTRHDLINEVILSEPVNSLTLEGASVSMSSINGARFTDIMISDNAPEDYIECITGPCTAYNFDEGVWGASGMYLSQGFVAVDPSVIPYGSLLYITNSDGSFVYGWAIAADYCEASAMGIVTVDLFFDTYEETLLFGKHTMNVYVVKQLYRDELQQYVARQGYFDNRVPGRP